MNIEVKEEDVSVIIFLFKMLIIATMTYFMALKIVNYDNKDIGKIKSVLQIAVSVFIMVCFKEFSNYFFNLLQLLIF